MREYSLEQWERDYLEIFVPPLTGFVRWAMDTAVRDGCRRIYFLARDGWLMKAAAEQLMRKTAAEQIMRKAEAGQSPIKAVEEQSHSGQTLGLHYLEVSRLSLRRAEYHLLGEKCLDYICAGGVDVSLRTIIYRSGVSRKMAQAVVDKLGMHGKLDVSLSWSQTAGLAKRLKTVPGFLEEVYTVSRKHYAGTIRYLDKEGLLDACDCAIVDTGWLGTVRESLDRLTGHELGKRKYGVTGQSEGLRKIRGYYFGLYELPPGVDKNLYKTYYFRPWRDIRRKVWFSNSLLEAVWSSPGAQTVGYTEDGFPIYGNTDNPNAARMHRERELLERKRLSQPKDSCWELFKKFMGSPTKSQAEGLGSLLFCDDMLDGRMQEVAVPMDDSQLRKQGLPFHAMERLGIYKGKLPESAWLEGSIVRNGHYVRWRLVRARIYKYLIYIRKWLKHTLQEYRVRKIEYEIRR